VEKVTGKQWWLVTSYDEEVRKNALVSCNGFPYL
jgi:hypothetical protein